MWSYLNDFFKVMNSDKEVFNAFLQEFLPEVITIYSLIQLSKISFLTDKHVWDKNF